MNNTGSNVGVQENGTVTKNVTMPRCVRGIFSGYTSMKTETDDRPDRDAVAAQRGDKHARDRLVAQFIGFAQRLARQLCRDRTSAQDAAQNGMLALLAAIENFDVELNKPFRSYAHAAIRWAIVRSIEAFDPDTIALDVSAPMADDPHATRHDITPDRSAADPEACAVLVDRLEQLTPSQRRAIHGRIIGATETETAAELGVSQQNISALTGRALRTLAA